jgi:hypothetical protein
MAVTPNSIITPQTPRGAVVTTTTANTTYTDSPSNVQTLATMGANGGRVTGLRSIPRATVTATALHLFLSTDGGTTKKLVRSTLMAADTVSATDAAAVTDWGLSEDAPMILPASAIVYVSQAVTLADGINTHIEWADY